LQVYDVLGKVIYETGLAGSNVSLHKADFDNGVYSYRVYDGGNIVSAGRFISN
jgi:hypothetical protein